MQNGVMQTVVRDVLPTGCATYAGNKVIYALSSTLLLIPQLICLLPFELV